MHRPCYQKDWFRRLVLSVVIVAVASSMPHISGREQDKHPTPDSNNQVVRKEDVDVYAAFILLQDYLPVGSHLGSGYRTQEDQISVIRSFAMANNIQVPSPGVTDPNAWRPVAGELRKMGYKIADPDRTPHSSNQRIVLDIGRADLGKIQAACYGAERDGLIEITNLIYEKKNQAIHVELNITARGIYQLGMRQPLLSGRSSESQSPQTGESAGQGDEERRQLMRELVTKHERNKGDPEKQIDFDEQRKQLLDPLNIDQIQKLDAEIEAHRREIAENKKNETKQSLIDEVRNAQQENRLQDAEQAAQRLVKAFPEEQPWLDQIKIRTLLDGAINALVTADCSSCETAGVLVGDALKLSAGDEKAQRIKGEVDNCISQCKTRRIALIVLSVLLLVGLIVGLYFWLRPKSWVLEVVDGPGTGQVFAVNKDKLIIGALGPGEDDDGDAADIVISDSNRKISRVHCVLRQHGRRVYLKDMSRNGTKINIIEIEPNRYVRLRNGDEISLADEAVLLLKHGAAEHS
jgi:Uncharacterized conserved protein, contains FHA domain